MRTAFIVAFAANVVLTVVSLVMLPSPMAIHFGADGVANGWAAGYVNALIMTGMELLLFCSFYFAPHLIQLFPAKWISLPHKEYWLQPEMMAVTRAKLASFMYTIGVAYLLFFFVIGLLTFQANRSDPVVLNLPPFYAALGLLLGYNLWWIVRLYMAFRPPADAVEEKGC